MGKTAGQERALQTLRETFGDRLKPAPEGSHALATVSPRDAGEVERLAAVAGRHAVPLVPLGAGTLAGDEGREDAVLVRFDLMGAIHLPKADAPWVEAEPGATLLSLENNLEARGLGLAVYPTSAPRATVGGWLAGEGIGVGSFGYGALPENVLSAEVVRNGEARKTVSGQELPEVLREDPRGLVVSARLRTRRARDVPFAARFEEAADLVAAVTRLADEHAPLWHLAFLNAAMSRARGLGEGALLFGAYPTEESSAVDEVLTAILEEASGRVLPPAEAHRVWGERFFPVAPSRPTPQAVREVVAPSDVSAFLRSEEGPVQGTVSRSGEVLLLVPKAGPVSGSRPRVRRGGGGRRGSSPG